MATGPIDGYPLEDWDSTAGWNFNAILSEFRNICGIPDASMYTDAQCATLINYYYQYVLPKELKIFWGYTKYTFFTQPNLNVYLAPTGFQTVNPDVYADGFCVEWYTDPDTFYQDYPQQLNKQVIATGAFPLNNFSASLSSFPLLPGSVYVTDGTQVIQDVPTLPFTGSGTFVQTAPAGNTGAVSSTVNYTTGVVSGSPFFITPPATGTNIQASYQSFNPNRPQGILFWPQTPLADSTQATLNAVNMFTLMPVPDQVYEIQMQGIQIPNAMVNYTDVPFRPDLGPLIALGAALHRFKLFNQMDQYEQYMPEYIRFKDVCMQDTYEEMLYERSISKF
jgi:hypothetical protein